VAEKRFSLTELRYRRAAPGIQIWQRDQNHEQPGRKWHLLANLDFFTIILTLVDFSSCNRKDALDLTETIDVQIKSEKVLTVLPGTPKNV
jgi:hypothetical protein